MKMSAFLGHNIATGSGGTTVYTQCCTKNCVLEAGSYVTIANAWRGFSHSPKFFCPPCRLSIQKCKMIQNLTAQLLLLLLLVDQLLLLLFFFYLSVNVVAKAGLDK